MLDLICGILLLGIGYAAGRRQVGKKAPGIALPEEERERAQKQQEQWEMMLDYGGRRPNGRN